MNPMVLAADGLLPAGHDEAQDALLPVRRPPADRPAEQDTSGPDGRDE
ncbi:hypothetical protein [Streptomyces mangrovisoli]|nr:hypothetical protein [Streptomyces mangrovisoli]